MLETSLCLKKLLSQVDVHLLFKIETSNIVFPRQLTLFSFSAAAIFSIRINVRSCKHDSSEFVK